MAGQFMSKTRRKVIPLVAQTKGTTNPLVWDIPKTGLLMGLWLSITGSVAGTLSAPNAFGMASIVRRVRVVANSGIDLIVLTGPQYHYLVRDMLEAYFDPVPSSTARNVVTATTFDVSMWLPIALNSRDPIGLFMLQNEETLLQLEVEFETDSIVATGATVTATVVPSMVIFTVPPAQEDWPPLNVVQQILGESTAIAAAGEFSYRWPRGNTYCQVIHGCGIAQAGADNWTEYKLRVNQSEVLERFTPNLMSLEYTLYHGRARLLGVIPVDLLGTAGLGNYGATRDLFHSALVTELESVITAAAAGTLHTVRRQLITLTS